MKKLKKIVLELITLGGIYHQFHDIVKRFELLEIHRLDGEALLTTELFQFQNSSMHPSNLVGHYGIEYIEVLSEDKTQNAYICFAKSRWPEEFSILYKDPEVMLCVPLVIADKTISISYMAPYDKIDKVWEHLQSVGHHFKVVSINTKPSSSQHLFFLLTERQREILFYAINHGYYEIPRKITPSDIAAKFNISKSGMNEHLRKIERVVFHSVSNL